MSAGLQRLDLPAEGFSIGGEILGQFIKSLLGERHHGLVAGHAVSLAERQGGDGVGLGMTPSNLIGVAECRFDAHRVGQEFDARRHRFRVFVRDEFFPVLVISPAMSLSAPEVGHQGQAGGLVTQIHCLIDAVESPSAIFVLVPQQPI